MIKNIRIFNRKIIPVILSSTILSTAMIGCSKKVSDRNSSQITISIDEKQDDTINTIVKNNTLYYNGLSEYFEHWSLFKKEELSEDVNKKIDALLVETKNSGMDLSEIDFDVIRQYILAPYVLYDGKKEAGVNILPDINNDGIEPIEAIFVLHDDHDNFKTFVIRKDEGNSIYYYHIEEFYKRNNAVISSSIQISKNGEYLVPYVCILPEEYSENASTISIDAIENKLQIIYKSYQQSYELSINDDSAKKRAEQFIQLISSNINELNDITISEFLDKYQNEIVDIFGEEYLKILQEQKTLVK